MWGHLGPEVPTRCASAEGSYESDDVFEGEDPKYEPDILDGQIIENAIRVLPDISRRVLKAVYIQYPYHRPHSIAQRLKISTDRYESQLRKAQEAVAYFYKQG